MSHYNDGPTNYVRKEAYEHVQAELAAVKAQLAIAVQAIRRAEGSANIIRVRTDMHKALAEIAAPAPTELCKDLRHVCGGCGFRWPERSAYDELVLENASLRERVSVLEKEKKEP